MALNMLSPVEIKAISFLDSTKSTHLPKLPDCKTVIGRRIQCSAQAPPPAWLGSAFPEPGRRTWDGPKPICIVGSTGSIGTQTLDIVAENSNKFKVVALVASSNVTLLVDQSCSASNCQSLE